MPPITSPFYTLYNPRSQGKISFIPGYTVIVSVIFLLLLPTRMSILLWDVYTRTADLQLLAGDVCS